MVEASKITAGHKHSKETRRKISEAQKGKPRLYQLGKKHWNWSGGMSEKKKIWRTKVFERDNYECCCCLLNLLGSNLMNIGLVAHHILEAEYKNGYPINNPDNFDIDNGLTLCKRCHWQIHTYPKIKQMEVYKFKDGR